jgi:hypothetical protein
MSRIQHMTVAAIAVLAGSACADRTPTESLAVSSSEVQFSVVSGNRQKALAGTELPNPIVVRVRDSTGKGVPGRLLNFVVTAGDGSVFAGRALTNADGIAQEWWRLGSTPGANRLEVRAVNSRTGRALVYGVFRATAR